MSRTWDFERGSLEMAVELCEGHPGAMSTLRRVRKMPDEKALRILFTQMAAMRMYGILLYYAFDVCEQDLQTFINRVSAMDTSLVDAVNKRLDAERVNFAQRLVNDGYIDWPSQLPDLVTVRRLASLLPN